MQSAFNLFDKIISRTRATPSEEDLRFLKLEMSLSDDLEVKRLWHESESARSKASALLTHISMMIAVIVVLLSNFSQNNFERIVLYLECVLYIFFALVCIRSLSIFGGSSGYTKDNYIERGTVEVLKRQAMVGFAIKGVFVTTLLFSITLLVHVLFGG